MRMAAFCFTHPQAFLAPASCSGAYVSFWVNHCALKSFRSMDRAEVADKLPFVGDVEPLASLEAGEPYNGLGCM